MLSCIIVNLQKKKQVKRQHVSRDRMWKREMSTKQEPVVKIRDLGKKIRSKWIVEGLNFDIYPGEIFGFLGPNGAGKTTTIRMMVGLISISKGDVTIQGNSVQKDYEQAIRQVGAIVENPEMYKFMSGYHNLVHYARMVSGVTTDRIMEVVHQVGLEKRIHDKVKNYSLGMRQRLGLAQALLHNPALLILDEPTNGLDPAGIREMRDYLRKICREEGVAVMVSSHLLSEMELMCDRVGIIQQGKLVGIQDVKDFVSEAAQVQVSFTVDPLDKASGIFQQFGFEVREEGSRLHVMLERDQIPEAVKQLVAEEVSIFEIHTLSKSLEDRFLEVTGGRGIV